MNRIRAIALSLCGFMCVNVCAEQLTWLDDWYEIEVIIFIQPDEPPQDDERPTPVVYTEDLIVAAPKVVENVTRAFPLTEEERDRILVRSSAIDLSIGSDPWFRPAEIENVSRGAQSIKTEVPSYGTFPEWMLPPGERYDPFFARVFRFVPFGDWFSTQSLSSLVDKEDENEENVHGELGLDGEETDATEKTVDDAATMRAEILEQLEAFREELELTSYIMDEQNVRLPRTAQRLRSKGAHVIKHFNWHQYVPPRSSKREYVFFQTLNEFPTEGYFGVSKGRFIHLDVHLWMHQSINTSDIRYPVYEMVELRRMEREDVHYFDHPKFGILAEVVRVDLPPNLQALWDSLN